MPETQYILKKALVHDFVVHDKDASPEDPSIRLMTLLTLCFFNKFGEYPHAFYMCGDHAKFLQAHIMETTPLKKLDFDEIGIFQIPIYQVDFYEYKKLQELIPKNFFPPNDSDIVLAASINNELLGTF